MTDTLIARLSDATTGNLFADRVEAADRIEALQSRLAALEGQEPVIDKQMLWLWKNGDHFLAFDNLYPCFTQGGDPMTLGEPAARAIFHTSFGSDARLAAGAAPTKDQT